jgi:integrase/recombinase XerD
VRKKQAIKIQDAYAAYRLDAQARRVTQATMRTYKDRLEPFITWCEQQGVTLVSGISSTLLRTYLVHLQDRHLASSTVNGTGRAIKAFLNFCVREGLLNESPMRRVVIPKIDKQILPSFSEDDVRRLLAACQNERDEAVILFLLDTGVRASEFANMKGGDIDLSSGAVVVRQGKGRKDRVVYLGAKARKQLLRYYMERGTPRADESIWIARQSNPYSEAGKPLSDSGLRQLLERVAIRANVKHCSPHTFRRTFALWSLRNGMTIYHLQRLMGHEDIQVLRRYLPLVEGDIKTAHQQSSPVDNMS